MNYGLAIKTIRNQLGLRQYQFANILFVSASYLSELEHNKTYPTLQLLENIAKLVPCSLSQLITYVEVLSGCSTFAKGYQDYIVVTFNDNLRKTYYTLQKRLVAS